MKERIDRFFFADAHPLGLIAARAILAIQALWILISRPGMARLTDWPAVFWTTPSLLWRFGIVPGAGSIDQVLYWLLIAALAAAAVGVVSRPACFAAAILLYHLAPMESVVGGLPYTTSVSGLTLPLLGLLILSFSIKPRLRDTPSPEYRWPLRLIQILFVLSYINSGLAKLHWAGIRWYSTENVGHLAVGFWMLYRPKLSLLVWQTPWLATAIGVGVFILEYGFVTTLFSKWARRILLPAAVFAFLLRIQVLGLFFLSFPSLLVMLNWDAIAIWWERATSTTPSGQNSRIPDSVVS